MPRLAVLRSHFVRRQKPGRQNRSREKDLRLLVNTERFGDRRDLSLFNNVEFGDVKLVPAQFLDTYSHEIEPAPGVKKLVAVSSYGQAVDSAHQRARWVNAAVVFRTQKRARQRRHRFKKPVQICFVQAINPTCRDVTYSLNESGRTPYAMFLNSLVQTRERRLHESRICERKGERTEAAFRATTSAMNMLSVPRGFTLHVIIDDGKGIPVPRYRPPQNLRGTAR